MIFMALCAAFALYWPVLHGELVFDDLAGIWKSPEVWKGNWRWFSLKRFRAIPYGSFAVQIAAHGPVEEGKPIPHTLLFSMHSFNIVLHALCAFVVGQITGSTVAMLLWIAMPVAVASVAYLSSRATLFAALFSLCGLWAVLGGYPELALPCIALAVMSKEDHAAIPFGLAASAYSVGQLGWAAIFAALPLIFGAIFWKNVKALIDVSHSQNILDAGMPSPFPVEGRRLTIAVELLLRFPQWVAGVGLCALPAFEKPTVAKRVGAWAVAVTALFSAIFIPETRLPLALILTSPLPLYLVFTNVRDSVMDYRAYIAMIGPFLLVPLLPWPLLVGILASWVILSHTRILGWRTPLDLWGMTVNDGGGPVAWQNLGSAYQMRGEFAKARECYAKCLAHYPDAGVVLLNLGLIEGMEGRPQSAKEKLEECVRLNPRYRAGWHYLAEVSAFMKDTVRAAECRKQLESLPS